MRGFDNAMVRASHIKGEVIDTYDYPDRIYFISCSCGWWKEERTQAFYDDNELTMAWMDHIKTL